MEGGKKARMERKKVRKIRKREKENKKRFCENVWLYFSFIAKMYILFF